MTHTPLFDPETDSRILIPAGALDGELKLAHESLDKLAVENIHDHNAMVRAAVELHYRLAYLVAAVEAGEH